MIRRDVDRDSLLITQADHAVLSRQLASRVGNGSFAALDPTAVTAIGLHDAGWPLHDDQPALNKSGRPLDVFEVPRAIGLPIWTASADSAEAVDAYAGLIVSLHSLSLGIMASGRPLSTRVDSALLASQFTLNQFQHREIERQENLRKRLEWPTDLPLHHGLADERASVIEDRLRFDFRWLKALDLLSLCLLCTKPPVPKTGEVYNRSGGSASPLKVHFDRSGAMRVRPWPFDTLRIELECPARRVWGGRWESVEKFRIDYASAKAELIPLRLRA
jgi:hypothetical protein